MRPVLVLTQSLKRCAAQKRSRAKRSHALPEASTQKLWKALISSCSLILRYPDGRGRPSPRNAHGNGGGRTAGTTGATGLFWQTADGSFLAWAQGGWVRGQQTALRFPNSKPAAAMQKAEQVQHPIVVAKLPGRNRRVPESLHKFLGFRIGGSQTRGGVGRDQAR